MTQSNAARSTRTSLRYLLLVAGAVVSLTPFLIMVSTSFKSQSFVLEVPPQLIPTKPTAQNYLDAVGSNGFGRYFLNSTLVTVAHVLLTLGLGSMMAYAFARFSFPGKRILFAALLSTLMIPTMTLLIPQFMVARDLGMRDTRLGLVLFYVATQLALITFLLRGFFAEIPKELEESMRMDGAGPWRIYRNLMLPLAKPALATAGIFTFLFSWDEFIWALTIIDNPDLRTLPIAISLFQGQHTTAWGLVFAASLIAVVPVLAVFCVFQRYFVSGLQTGALKG